MFKKLKHKFILTNLLLTTVVLLAAYTSVYLIAASNSANRRPIPSDAPAYTSEVENIIDEHIKSDRKKALSSLLFTLIATGVATELVVFIISAYLAEEAIKPVKEAYEAQKLFIANASHEIKTPLAAISANLEAADISIGSITSASKSKNSPTSTESSLLSPKPTSLPKKSSSPT